MLYGIKYQTENQKLIKLNEKLKKLNLAILFDGKCKFVLDNAIAAIFVAKSLNKSQKQVIYKVYKLSPDEATQVKKENIASSVEEFQQLVNSALKKIDKLSAMKREQTRQ